MDVSLRTSTFVSIDVVGSTQIKSGETEADIMATFLAYHKQASDLAYAHNGQVINITGDGMMCRFEKPEDAVGMAEAMVLELPLFNKRDNRLMHSLRLRLGIHTGEVREMQGVSSGQWISPTLDRTAKLQAGAAPDGIRISETTYSLIDKNKKMFAHAGWEAALQMNVYAYQAAAPRSLALHTLPEQPRLLLLDQDLEDVDCLTQALLAHRRDPLTAYTVAQADLILSVWKPHGLLLSLDLPWDAGWHFLGALRSNAAWSRMPVIALSRHSEGEKVQKCLGMGANGFINKPIDVPQAMKHLETTMRDFYL